MDPNVALAELRRLFAGLPDGKPRSEAYEDAAELFSGLDDWLSRRGALPRDWERR